MTMDERVALTSALVGFLAIVAVAAFFDLLLD
jgi:hypothetical protein